MREVGEIEGAYQAAMADVETLGTVCFSLSFYTHCHSHSHTDLPLSHRLSRKSRRVDDPVDKGGSAQDGKARKGARVAAADRDGWRFRTPETPRL